MKALILLVMILFLADGLLDCFWSSRIARRAGRKKQQGGTEPAGKKASPAAAEEGAGSSFVSWLDRQKFRWSKFLLMPLLLLFYLLASTYQFPFAGAADVSGFVAAALVFGFAGDTLLELGSRWFLGGVLGFLLGHICYMIRFLSPVSFAAVSGWTYLILLPLSVYMFLMLKELGSVPATKRMLPALLAYLLCLAGLGFCAFMRLGTAPALSFVLTFVGAVSFIASDTMLAFRMFRTFPEGGVMPTYLAGQTLITLGMIFSRGV